MTLSITLNPDWPYIAALTFVGACLYAVTVVRLNNHPRYGRYWQRLSWVEVVGGTLLMAATALWLFGPSAFVAMLAVAALWGLPMIVAVLAADSRVEAERDEQADAGR